MKNHDIVTNTSNAAAVVDELAPLISRLDRDVVAAAVTLSQRELRYLVDCYYSLQKIRIQTSNAASSAAKSGEPAAITSWICDQFRLLESRIRAFMRSWVAERDEGEWLLSITGIGPVIAAGLLAHVDPARCPTAGALWSYAGLNPTQRWLGRDAARRLLAVVLDGRHDETWEGEIAATDDDWDDSLLSPAEAEELARILGASPGELTREQLWRISRLTGRRLPNLVRAATGPDGRITRESVFRLLCQAPYNRRLKRLCFIIGDSFCKFHNNPTCYYGHVYADRKSLEVARNEAGAFRDQAEASLAGRNLSAESRDWYARGLLPPARIELRARRYAVKLFLAHFQQVVREANGLPVVAPYAIEHLGHAHLITPPGWPLAR